MVEHRGEEDQPLFVARTEEEYEAKFGATREAGRLSAAKGAGFESVAELEEAVKGLAELSEAKQRAAASREERDQSREELRALRVELGVEREARLQALDLGGTPQAISDILTLRRKTSDVLEDGEPKVDAIRGSIEDVFNAHPQLRGGQVRARSSAATSTGGLVDGIKARLREKFQRR